MGSEDQALIVHSKKIRRDYHHLKGKHFKFTCDERGHFAIYCPKNNNISHKKKGNNKRHQVHSTEDD